MHYDLVTLREQGEHCTVPNTLLGKERSEYQETHLNELLVSENISNDTKHDSVTILCK